MTGDRDRRRAGSLALISALAVVLAGCGSGRDASAGPAGPSAAGPVPAHAAAVARQTPGTSASTDDMQGMDMDHMDHMDQHAMSQQASVHGFTLNVPLPRPEFVLTDTHGRSYDFATRTRGKATLLYFGYTDCPYQCPTTMADIGIALHKLPTSVQHRVTVVFVTTDPQHDSPAVLRKWLGQFDSHFIGLTGTKAQSRAAQSAAHVTTSAPQPGEAAPAGPASTQHGGGALAYGRDDYAHVTYPAGTSTADLVRDLPRLVQNKGGH